MALNLSGGLGAPRGKYSPAEHYKIDAKKWGYKGSLGLILSGRPGATGPGS